jgi:hypothetical protein
MVVPDDILFAIMLGALSVVGFLFAVIGRPLFDVVSKISKYNVLISKSNLRLMTSPVFVRTMRIFFLFVSIGMACGAFNIVFGGN